MTAIGIAGTADPREPHALDHAPVAVRARLELRRVGRIVGTAVFVFLVVLGIWESAITTVMHSQRQHHLASDYAAKRATASDGQALAVLQIPVLGLNQYVSELATLRNLRGGPAHLSTSVAPGELGTSVVFGKRTRYGGPFRSLESLKPGDQIFTQVRAKTPVLFTVSSVDRHVDPEQLIVAADSSHSTLLLATSESGVFTRQLVVVHATSTSASTTSEPSPQAFEPQSLVMDRGSLFFGRPMLLGYAAVVLAYFVVSYLRRRYRLRVVVIACAPMVFAACALLLLELDRFLPATH